jgi:hypothetical protein
MSRTNCSQTRFRKKQTGIRSLMGAILIELLGLMIFLSLLSAVREKNSLWKIYSNPQNESFRISILPPRMCGSELSEYSAGRVDSEY